MKIIEKISEMIEEEIDGAYHYAKCAVMYKEDNPTLAATLYNISSQELSHITLLHDEAVRLINQYRAENGDAPEMMKAIYDYLHKKHIEDVNEVKMLHAQYKE